MSRRLYCFPRVTLCNFFLFLLIYGGFGFWDWGPILGFWGWGVGTCMVVIECPEYVLIDLGFFFGLSVGIGIFGSLGSCA